MPSKQPFARRIVIAFTLMTLVVGGIFSLSIVGIVHFIEEHLVSKELNYELENLLTEDLQAGDAVRLDSNTHFFTSSGDRHAIPEQFAQLPNGFSEVVDASGAYYAFQRTVAGERYLLVQEQHEFEEREQTLFDVVLAGFLFSVVAAWGLGWMVARRVMKPVIRLAQQVRHRDQLHPLAPALAPEYADDEIGHLAAAFDSTLGQLRLSLERERLFTSDVSHELRTPLMVISTACELLAEYPLETRERELVARIGRATEEMRDLVQTFLMLARAQPDQAIAGGRATLAGVAEEQSRRWEPPIRGKGLQFEVRVQGEDDAHYNLTFLSTVMSNLLRNALHYTERGSVSLVLEAGGFRVEDTGCGIPPDQQAHLFQPFVRGAEARGEGLGLGLSLVKRICAQQGWAVSVHERQPHGACFQVSLRSPAGMDEQ